jgi:signal transduction histidine kinase/DNA-binding response OmpR family regulator/sugar lactone lactonase YvrE
MTVAQDSSGFIWVGTHRGLDRYDGYQLKPYSLPVTKQGVAGNRIRTVYAAPGGRLWVGSDRAGLSYYDAATDRLLTLASQAAPAATRSLLHRLSEASVLAIAADARGRLWVGTQGMGLLVLRFGPGGQLAAMRQVPLGTNPADSSLTVSALAIDDKSNVWLGTYAGGLRVLWPGHPTAELTPLTEGVRTLHLDRRGDLWVGTNKRVYWMSAVNRRVGRELAIYPLSPTLPQLQSLLLDTMGRLWAGTINGLYVWEAASPTGKAPPLAATPIRLSPQDGEPFSLNSERIHYIFEDRTQVMWLCASAGGLNWVDLRQKPFGQLQRQFTGSPALPSSYINAIYKDEAANTLWLGTRNGVSAYNLTTHRYRNYLTHPEADQRTDVSSIWRSRDGALWLGTRYRGLGRLVRRPDGSETFTTFTRWPGAPPLSSTSIEHIAEDNEGTLWVATFEKGLYRLNAQGQLLGYYPAGRKGLPTGRFTFLLYDPAQNVLWASTADKGLLKLQPGGPDSLRLLRQFDHQPNGQGLRVSFVWPLLLDRQGTLWLGTIGGGLHRLVPSADGQPERLEYLGQDVPESDVESLLTDSAGNIWIGGAGLYRYTPSTRRYVRYDVADGLQSNSFKVGAATRGADGTLYFGGINGVSYFEPADIKPNPYAPLIRITALRVANQPVAVGQQVNGRVLLRRPLTETQELRIGPGENDFSVDFVGLNYANPQKTRYAYQLMGYNQDWVTPPPGQRTASFANLPPGHYTLRLRANNGEGNWSAPVAPLRFEVLAPWYKTSWAYLGYALLLLGSAVLYRRVEISQQALRSRLAIEQFQAEKEKELTNLKLGFFTNISHELRTPLTLIMGPMEEIVRSAGPVADLRDKAQLMYRQAGKLLDLVNQLLDFRKVETGHVPLRASRHEVGAFLREQYAAFELKARERNVQYVLDLPPEPHWLYFDQGKLEIILTNLLANAFKYVREKGRVELAATSVGNTAGDGVFERGQLVGNYLKITVSDTGVGIRPEELGRIFDPYYQAAHTNTLRMQGTGIGLALARQFALRHGGQLTVSSALGVGSTFELRLPFGQAHLAADDLEPTAPPALPDLENPTPPVPEPETEAELEAAADEPAAPSGPPRLLLVEDNDDVREYLRELFAADYQVQTAEDGVVGLDKALANLPDLIISDVMMPHSDGLELCKRLKQNPKTSHIPVILLTARTTETHELEGFGMGADDYISKPFNPTLLRAKAEALLRNRRKLHQFYQHNILLQPSEIVVADADREFLENAMAIVERHLDDSDFNVQVLVREMAMSQSVVSRRIKSLTGQTAVEFIRDVRLKRAAQLLAQSQLRVSEIAFEVGIENLQYFRKMFQKMFSVTPSEYARQHRPAAPAKEENDGTED